MQCFKYGRMAEKRVTERLEKVTKRGFFYRTDKSKDLLINDVFFNTNRNFTKF